eukprot:1975111-Rhodomonas_salina.1
MSLPQIGLRFLLVALPVLQRMAPPFCDAFSFQRLHSYSLHDILAILTVLFVPTFSSLLSSLFSRALAVAVAVVLVSVARAAVRVVAHGFCSLFVLFAFWRCRVSSSSWVSSYPSRSLAGVVGAAACWKAEGDPDGVLVVLVLVADV